MITFIANFWFQEMLWTMYDEGDYGSPPRNHIWIVFALVNQTIKKTFNFSSFPKLKRFEWYEKAELVYFLSFI